MSVSHATYGAARSVFSPSPAWKGKTGKEKYAGGTFYQRDSKRHKCSVFLWKGPLLPERVRNVVWHKKPVTIPTICEANRA